MLEFSGLNEKPAGRHYDFIVLFCRITVNNRTIVCWHSLMAHFSHCPQMCCWVFTKVLQDTVCPNWFSLHFLLSLFDAGHILIDMADEVN